MAVHFRSYVPKRVRIRCIQLSFRIHGDSDAAFGRADQYSSSCIWSFQYAGKPDRGPDAEQPSVVTFPFLLTAVYAVLFFLGCFTVPMAVLTFVWGVLAGAAANINQYWLATAAPKAPDFANGLFLASTNLGTTVGTSVCGFFLSRMNGLFLASTNLGTTVGTSVCGFFLSRMGTQYIVLGGILFIACAFVLITMRVRSEKRVQNAGKKLKTA